MLDKKIFGVGLNKTGTKTLAKALYDLGYRNRVSCRRDLLIAYREGRFDGIFAIADQNNIFEDWPWCLLYQEMFQRFGDSARYILTRRKNSNSWLESLKKHSIRVCPDFNCRAFAYGHNYPHGLETYHMDFYERHNDEVRNFFAKNNSEHLLLEICFDEGDDWKKLCSFLGLQIPNTVFPHENSSLDIHIPREFEFKNWRNIAMQLQSLAEDCHAKML